jgi:hypothetical protein
LNTIELEKRYARFSGLTHFLDPSKDIEERPIDVDLSKYDHVLNLLDQKTDFTVEQLSDLFRETPEAIRLFELMLQLSNFTTAQRTFLMFDLDLLNSSNLNDSVSYIVNELNSDESLKKHAMKKGLLPSDTILELDQMTDDTKFLFLAKAKRLIAYYCNMKNPALVQERLRNSDKVRKRAAKYLIENRGLNDILQGIRPSVFMEKKRIPVDTKSSHGKYSSQILESILVNAKFEKNDNKGPCNDLMIQRTGRLQQLLGNTNDEFTYCREREVESLSQPKTSVSSESATTGAESSKRFDFVLLFSNQPKVVIETNFYTTSGSKIGINEKEYLALHKKINEKEKGLRFIWVTDGSYWLTETGKKSFRKLAPAFGDNLKNLAMFAEDINQIKEGMR